MSAVGRYLAATCRTAALRFGAVASVIVMDYSSLFWATLYGWLFFAILPLGSWALVANGVFFAALSLRARSRELLLPLVLFPIFIPALLAMVLAATDVLTGEADPGLWVKMLVGYDIVFTVLSVLLFETVFHAE